MPPVGLLTKVRPVKGADPPKLKHMLPLSNEQSIWSKQATVERKKRKRTAMEDLILSFKVHERRYKVSAEQRNT